MPQSPVSIDQVVTLLGLERDPHSGGASASSYNVRCPFCGDKKYHMNIDRRKDTYNCLRCSGEKTGGGALDLYGRAALGMELIKGGKKGGGNGHIIYAKLAEALNLGTTPMAPVKKTAPKQSEASGVHPAKDEKLHEVFTALLGLKALDLTENHRRNLLKRGLDDVAIARNGYRSVKKDLTWVDEYPHYSKQFSSLGIERECRKHASLAKAPRKMLLAHYIVGQETMAKSKYKDLSGVPGFYKIKDAWMFRLDVGMLIPTRNCKGQIVCLQTRLDRKAGELRYLTVSSKGLPEGVTEKISRTHFPLGNAPLSPTTQVLLTEGPLKADVAAHLLGGKAFFMAIQGVNNRNELPSLFRRLRAAGVNSVYNALDMDKTTNPHVASAGKVLRSLAQSEGLQLRMKCWDRDGAQAKLAELLDVCDAYGLDPGELSDNVYVAVGEVAALLNLESVPYCEIKMSNGSVKKNYWPDETKGIDDFLLRCRKTSS